MKKKSGEKRKAGHKQFFPSVLCSLMFNTCEREELEGIEDERAEARVDFNKRQRGWKGNLSTNCIRLLKRLRGNRISVTETSSREQKRD